MNTENTNDLKEFFSNENLNFFKNLNQELLKIETLLEKNQAKEEKYSLFLATLTSKDFSNTNKEYLFFAWKKYWYSKRFKIDSIIS